jgi:putative acetyltransferase
MSQSDDIKFRHASPEDFNTLGEVMFDAVRNGASPYTEEQRKAWIAAPRNDPIWHQRLRQQRIVIALRGEEIAGFISIAGKGYIDFAYIRPAFQNSGLFRKLYTRIEQLAVVEKQNRLWVHASLKAQPAFLAMGFQITKTESVELNGQILKRFEMEKLLNFL